MRRSLRFPVTLFENTELSGKLTKFLHEIPPIAGPSVSRLTMAVRKESRKWSKLMREFCMDSPWSRAGVSPDHHALSPRLYTRQLVEEADGLSGTNERESFADINRASTGNSKRSPCVSLKHTELDQSSVLIKTKVFSTSCILLSSKRYQDFVFRFKTNGTNELKWKINPTWLQGLARPM